MFDPIQSIQHVRLCGMTQTAIALATGTTQATISRLEAGVAKNASFVLAQKLDRVAQRALKVYHSKVTESTL